MKSISATDATAALVASPSSVAGDANPAGPRVRKNSISEQVKSDLYDHLYELSHRILPRFSGSQLHIRSVSQLVEGFTLKYKDNYNINMMTVDHSTPKETIQSFLADNHACAIIHDGKPHQTPIVKLDDRLIVFSKLNYDFIDFFNFHDPDRIYFLDDEIFKKPELEPAQDEEAIDYQADPVSCGLFAVKMAKELLKDDAKTLKQTVFDENAITAYPPPNVFKQSQSNIFLKYYIPRFVNKRNELRSPESKVANTDSEVEHLSEEVAKYRANHFGKGRMFFYNIKYFPHIKQMYENANSENA